MRVNTASCDSSSASRSSAHCATWASGVETLRPRRASVARRSPTAIQCANGVVDELEVSQQLDHGRAIAAAHAAQQLRDDDRRHRDRAETKRFFQPLRRTAGEEVDPDRRVNDDGAHGDLEIDGQADLALERHRLPIRVGAPKPLESFDERLGDAAAGRLHGLIEEIARQVRRDAAGSHTDDHNERIDETSIHVEMAAEYSRGTTVMTL